MPIVLPNGSIADTGVAQESPAHRVMESTAHQRDCFPYKISSSINLNNGWAPNWTFPGPVMSVYPAWDAGFEQFGYDWPHGFNQYDQGAVDAYGYEFNLPSPDPAMVFDNSSIWSADITGQPYIGTAGSNTGGPAYEYFFNFGTSVIIPYRGWYKAGTYGAVSKALRLGDGSLNEGFGQMNDDFAGTITIGPLVISFSRSAGFSGTGVSNNATIAGPPNGYGGYLGWGADFNHTFAERFQITIQMGPMSYWSGGTAKDGGGFLEFVASSPFP